MTSKPTQTRPLEPLAKVETFLTFQSVGTKLHLLAQKLRPTTFKNSIAKKYGNNLLAAPTLVPVRLQLWRAIAFDLDTAGMKAEGMTAAQITTVCKREIPDALTGCGFTAHPQGSLYHTETNQNPITAIMKLQNALRTQAPTFCQHVRRVDVFRMEEWSDVTELIANRPNAGVPTAEEELEEQEAIPVKELVSVTLAR